MSEQRVQTTEQTLRVRYEALLDAKQQELDLILSSNQRAEHEEKQRWEQMMAAMKGTHLTLLEEYESQIRGKYEEYLREWEQRCRTETSRLEQHALLQANSLAEERRRNESYIRKLHVAASKWRADYQHTTKSQYDMLMSELENHYTQLLEQRNKEISEQQERMAVQLLVLQQKSAQDRETASKCQHEMQLLQEKDSVAQQEAKEGLEVYVLVDQCIDVYV